MPGSTKVRAPVKRGSTFQLAVYRLVETIPPSLLLEFYDWALEPELLRALRNVASLSESNLSALSRFLDNAPGRSTIGVRSEPNGQLVLSVNNIGNDMTCERLRTAERS
jgi:hypothetical protein